MAIAYTWLRILLFAGSVALVLLLTTTGYTQNGGLPHSPFDKLNFREIGPATPSGRLGGLKGGILASTLRPTEVQMRQLAEVKPAFDKVLGEANALIADLNTLAKEAAESGVYPTAVKPIER